MESTTTNGMFGIDLFRAFSAQHGGCPESWGVAPGYYIARLWRSASLTALGGGKAAGDPRLFPAAYGPRLEAVSRMNSLAFRRVICGLRFGGRSTSEARDARADWLGQSASAASPALPARR